MASRFVTELILAAARPIVATIRKGKPLATIVGAFLGAALATSSGFVVMIELVPFFVVVGAIMGAAFTAALFKRPASNLGARETDLEPFRPGAVLQTWAFGAGDFQSLTVLLEHALYVVRDETAPWEEVVRKLSQGEDPQLPLGGLVRLDELSRIEMKSPEAKEITLVHMPAGRIRRRPCYFGTTEERNALIAFLEQQIGKTFTRIERPLDFHIAIRTPALLAAIGGILFSLVAWLSAHWTANPPPPPRGKAEQDPLVRVVVWVGPGIFLLVATVIVLATLAWLASRVLRPPRVQVIQIHDVETPG